MTYKATFSEKFVSMNKETNNEMFRGIRILFKTKGTNSKTTSLHGWNNFLYLVDLSTQMYDSKNYLFLVRYRKLNPVLEEERREERAKEEHWRKEWEENWKARYLFCNLLILTGQKSMISKRFFIPDCFGLKEPSYFSEGHWYTSRRPNQFSCVHKLLPTYPIIIPRWLHFHSPIRILLRGNGNQCIAYSYTITLLSSKHIRWVNNGDVSSVV